MNKTQDLTAHDLNGALANIATGTSDLIAIHTRTKWILLTTTDKTGNSTISATGNGSHQDNIHALTAAAQIPADGILFLPADVYELKITNNSGATNTYFLMWGN